MNASDMRFTVSMICIALAVLLYVGTAYLLATHDARTFVRQRWRDRRGRR
jgi:hypothetical protein